MVWVEPLKLLLERHTSPCYIKRHSMLTSRYCSSSCGCGGGSSGSSNSSGSNQATWGSKHAWQHLMRVGTCWQNFHHFSHHSILNLSKIYLRNNCCHKSPTTVAFNLNLIPVMVMMICNEIKRFLLRCQSPNCKAVDTTNTTQRQLIKLENLEKLLFSTCWKLKVFLSNEWAIIQTPVGILL